MKICFNGDVYSADAPVLMVQNRSYKWGDGLFETIKVFDGQLLLGTLHFERLFTSLKLLQIETGGDFIEALLVEKIILLCQQNNCLRSARIRLAVYRNE